MIPGCFRVTIIAYLMDAESIVLALITLVFLEAWGASFSLHTQVQIIPFYGKHHN